MLCSDREWINMHLLTAIDLMDSDRPNSAAYHLLDALNRLDIAHSTRLELIQILRDHGVQQRDRELDLCHP